jgi:MoxR-like ATPase
MKTAASEPRAVQEKFLSTRRELSEALIERDDEIDLVLTALIAQENLLLVGPPGTAKSLLLDALAGWLHGRKFTVLLTKFSQPEELFGPFSLRGLKEDRYVRVTARRLPEADLAFLDEIWKASSAILNTLLYILNERIFDAGDGTLVKVPLKICVAASNEWPSDQEGGKELNALFDRFLLRKRVRPILSQSGRQRLLWKRDHTPKLSTSITPAEIDLAHQQALALPWSDDARQAFEQILRELAAEGIVPGDRRQFKSVAVCQAFAFLNGCDRVEPEYLEVLAHTLWDSPEEQPEKVAQVVGRIANPIGMKVNQLLLECEQILAATNPRILAQASAATAKLGEIDKQLGMLRTDSRQIRARAYVREQIRLIKLASLDAI